MFTSMCHRRLLLLVPTTGQLHIGTMVFGRFGLTSNGGDLTISYWNGSDFDMAYPSEYHSLTVTFLLR